MEWEDKVKMVQLGNDSDSRKEFQDFVLGKISDFDAQAWDMFITQVELIPLEMKKESDFWKQVYPSMNSFFSTDGDVSFRAQMRLSLAIVICEEEIILNKKNES